jgi:hypothetical protein
MIDLVYWAHLNYRRTILLLEEILALVNLLEMQAAIEGDCLLGTFATYRSWSLKHAHD